MGEAAGVAAELGVAGAAGCLCSSYYDCCLDANDFDLQNVAVAFGDAGGGADAVVAGGALVDVSGVVVAGAGPGGVVGVGAGAHDGGPCRRLGNPRRPRSWAYRQPDDRGTAGEGVAAVAVDGSAVAVAAGGYDVGDPSRDQS